jgi:hypothetical protein
MTEIILFYRRKMFWKYFNKITFCRNISMLIILTDISCFSCEKQESTSLEKCNLYLSTKSSHVNFSLWHSERSCLFNIFVNKRNKTRKVYSSEYTKVLEVFVEPHHGWWRQKGKQVNKYDKLWLCIQCCWLIIVITRLDQKEYPRQTSWYCSYCLVLLYSCD